MNKEQLEYLRAYHKTQSVKAMARHLGLGKKQIQSQLRQLLTADEQQVTRKSPAAGFPHKRQHYLFLLFFLLTFVFGVYARTISYPFVNWDDRTYVVENADIRRLSWENIQKMATQHYVETYVPLTMLSFALDYQLFHFNPAGYHVTNIILHLLSTALVFWLAGTLSGNWRVAFGTALIFGVHPIQTESVVWISQRKNVLSYFLFMVSMAAYVHSRQHPEKGRFYLLISWLAFIAACFAKALVVVLPAVLFAFDYLYGHWKKKDWLRYLPFVGAAIIFAVIAKGIVEGVDQSVLDEGKMTPSFLSCLVITIKYFQLLFFPKNLSVFYQYSGLTFANPVVALSLALVPALAAGLVWLWHRHKRLFFWAAWTAIILSPALYAAWIHSAAAERWLYLPVVGVSIILFTLLEKWLGTKPMLAVMAASVLIFTVLNINRQSVWASPEKLWQSTQSRLGKTTTIPFHNLGIDYIRQGQLDQGIEALKQSLAIQETPDTLSALGTAYDKKGDYETAMDYLKRAIDLEPGVSTYHNELGLVYSRQNHIVEAIDEYEEAIRLDPEDTASRSNLAKLYAMTGRKEEARQALEKMLAIDPDLEEGLFNYALFLFQEGELRESKKHLMRFLEIHPRSTLVGQVNLLLSRIQESEKLMQDVPVKP